MYRPRSVAGTKGDSAVSRISIFSTFNISMARIKRRCIGVDLSNVGDTTKMATDDVIALSILQLPRTVIADSVAVTIPSIDIAYSP